MKPFVQYHEIHLLAFTIYIILVLNFAIYTLKNFISWVSNFVINFLLNILPDYILQLP